MNTVQSGQVTLAWDAETRIAIMRFLAPTRLTGKDSTALVQALTAWVGGDERPFAILVDGHNYTDVDAEARAVWARYLSVRKHYAYVSLWGMGLITRIASEMFRIGTGTPLKIFSTEEAARAWLRGRGLAA